MKRFQVFAGALLAQLIFGPQLFAQQCDCQKILGECTGAVEFVRGYGSKPSFGAELIIHSSEKSCSKIEYLIDSTPYQTVLVNKQKEEESIFGTSPITVANVSYSRCVICASIENSSQSSLESNANPFIGSWRGISRNSLGLERDKRIIIDVGSDSAVRFTQYSVNNNSYEVAGTLTGNVITYLISGGCSGTLSLNSDGTIEDQCGWSMYSQHGRLIRQ